MAIHDHLDQGQGHLFVVSNDSLCLALFANLPLFFTLCDILVTLKATLLCPNPCWLVSV